ncbi:hypothetical protein DC31_07825 [Microbacterium sp. CH12i]|uniref:GmrSD restriction endonuclease domain-containing protein n=1 Tax=Microbacterium sp. CH12i TaxID=1479651 RepID=UPI000460F903|nr:DUF262 domain-containing protein [Microbacterium sp. CH12i]KDA06871.1 hypothetical protein DC31_07825 [Microbacterium sp. CH12i]
MKTDVVKPQGVFFNPVRLVVPLFQRPYVWSKETQWEPLWQDIVRLIEVIEKHDAAASHFLGAIVIQQVPVALGSLPAWNVIDGQQRLTTLQLLLDALHSELERRGWTGLASRVHSLIENPPEHCEAEEDRFKLWPTNRDRDGFSQVMSAPTPVDYSAVEASRLRDAHRFFADSIAEWLGEDEGAEKRARVLVATVTDRLEIASISLDANEDAQAIFETLNARGTPLSAADLIKNFVFQQVSARDAERLYFANWAEFETPWWEREVTSGRIKNPRSSLFLWQWLMARTLDDFPIREVFTQFKHYVNTVEKDVTVLLPQIKAAADRYRSIIEGAERPDGPLSRVELFSYRVAALDSDIVRPLVIWLGEPEQDAVPDEARERVLAMVESWLVRRALVKVTSQGANRFTLDLMRYLSEQTKESLPEATERYLAGNQTVVGYWPGDAEVRDALLLEPAYWNFRRGRLRMVLEAIEDHKRGYPDGGRLAMSPITRGKATIEHLMPQSWQRNWAIESAEESAERDQAVQRLGNLTLVTQALNSKVSNGAWEVKRAHFRGINDVLLTGEALALAGEDTWSERQIAARTERLIESIVMIWPVPAGHTSYGGGERRMAERRADVDLAQLVSEGWIEPGTRLRAASQAHAEREAAIAQDGRVHFEGVPYDSPSGALRALRGRGGNGWWHWMLVEDGRRLSEVRSDYLASLGEAEAVTETADEVEES